MENPVIFASTAVAQDVRSELCCAQFGAEFHVGEQNSFGSAFHGGPTTALVRHRADAHHWQLNILTWWPLAPRIIPLMVEDSAVASFW